MSTLFGIIWEIQKAEQEGRDSISIDKLRLLLGKRIPSPDITIDLSAEIVNDKTKPFSEWLRDLIGTCGVIYENNPLRYALMRYGVETIVDLKEAVADGSIKNMRLIGKKRLREIDRIIEIYDNRGQYPKPNTPQNLNGLEIRILKNRAK